MFFRFLSCKLPDFSYFPAGALLGLTPRIFANICSLFFLRKLTGRASLFSQHQWSFDMRVLVVALFCSHSLSTCFPKNFCWVIIFYTPWTVMVCHKNQLHAVKGEVKPGHFKWAISHMASGLGRPSRTSVRISSWSRHFKNILIDAVTSVDYELSDLASGCRARLHPDSATWRVDAIILPSLLQTLCLPGNTSQQASKSCGSCWHNTRKTEVANQGFV